MKKRRNRNLIKKKIALQRIKILFREADKVFPESKKLANRYVDLARKIAMKVNLKLPRELKRRFCKYCYSFLKPGVNLTVRAKNMIVHYYCHECKKIMRFPYIREKKQKLKN